MTSTYVEIDIAYDAPLWEEVLPDGQEFFCILVNYIWSFFKWQQPAQLSVLLTSDATIQGLNHTYRHQDKPTNVLSFPQDGADWQSKHQIFSNKACANQVLGNKIVLLGDLVFALETIQREAVSEDKSFHHHLTHLVTHGLLHLLGYNHEEEDQAQQMEALEIKILSELGIQNPYEELATENL